MKKREPLDATLLYELMAMSFDLAAQTKSLIGGVLAELNLTRSLANALWLMDPGGAPPNMSELAGMLHCDRSTVTFIADRLEGLKLMHRKVDPENRRVKILVLTAQGRRVRQRLMAEMTSRTPIAKLTQDEQKQLHTLFEKAGLKAEPDVQEAEAAHRMTS